MFVVVMNQMRLLIDCNYPTKAGRWLSMNALLDRFGVNIEDI